MRLNEKQTGLALLGASASKLVVPNCFAAGKIVALKYTGVQNDFRLLAYRFSCSGIFTPFHKAL